MFKTPVFFFSPGVALSKLTNILGFVIIHCWHLQPVFHRMTGSGNTALSWIPVGKITSKHLVFCERQIWSVGEMSLPSPAPQKIQGNLYTVRFLHFLTSVLSLSLEKWPERRWWWKKVRHDGAQAVCVQVMSTALIYPIITHYPIVYYT